MKPIDQEFDSESEVEEGGEMTFLEHLEELRWHIVRAIGSIAIFAIIAFIFIRANLRLSYSGAFQDEFLDVSHDV
jgi:sec-independent protein translocase protein TatC